MFILLQRGWVWISVSQEVSHLPLRLGARGALVREFRFRREARLLLGADARGVSIRREQAVSQRCIA